MTADLSKPLFGHLPNALGCQTVRLRTSYGQLKEGK